MDPMGRCQRDHSSGLKTIPCWDRVLDIRFLPMDVVDLHVCVTIPSSKINTDYTTTQPNYWVSRVWFKKNIILIG